MPLTVEDGSGLAAADSYVSLVDAKAYFDLMGLDYSGVSDALLEQALRRAAAFLDRSYVWEGARVNGRAQGLSHPRTGLTDADGLAVGSSEVATEIKHAQMELAHYSRADAQALAPVVDTSSGVVKSEKYDVVEFEYFESGAQSIGANRLPVLTNVRDLLAPFIVSETTGSASSGYPTPSFGKADRTT